MKFLDAFIICPAVPSALVRRLRREKLGLLVPVRLGHVDPDRKRAHLGSMRSGLEIRNVRRQRLAAERAAPHAPPLPPSNRHRMTLQLCFGRVSVAQYPHDAALQTPASIGISRISCRRAGHS
jgi:hypothetical protein